MEGFEPPILLVQTRRLSPRLHPVMFNQYIKKQKQCLVIQRFSVFDGTKINPVFSKIRRIR